MIMQQVQQGIVHHATSHQPTRLSRSVLPLLPGEELKGATGSIWWKCAQCYKVQKHRKWRHKCRNGRHKKGWWKPYSNRFKRNTLSAIGSGVHVTP